MSTHHRVVRDNVHRDITLTPDISRLVDTATFQRLRNDYQPPVAVLRLPDGRRTAAQDQIHQQFENFWHHRVFHRYGKENGPRPPDLQKLLKQVWQILRVATKRA